jgi:hypothetical protein
LTEYVAAGLGEGELEDADTVALGSEVGLAEGVEEFVHPLANNAVESSPAAHVANRRHLLGILNP